MSIARRWKRLATPGEWVILFVGVILANVYVTIVDDAYINFRYVDNLVFLKLGLVFNHGEYVEGFTSPLFILLLSLLRLFRLNYGAIVLLVANLSYLAFWYGLVALNRAPGNRRRLGPNIPLVLLGLNYGVLSNFTGGLETPIVLVSAVGCALMLSGRRSNWIQIGLGVIPLVRPELTVAVIVLAVSARVSDGRWPRPLLASWGVSSLAWTIFRVYYYADLFPNTYHLKDELAPRQTYQVPTLALIGATWLLIRRRLESRGFLVIRSIRPPTYWAAGALAAALIAAYYVKIGGGFRHFRYLAFPYALGICCASGILDARLAVVRPLGSTCRRRLMSALCVGAGISMLWLHPRHLLDGHPLLIFRNVQPQPRTVHGVFDVAFLRGGTVWGRMKRDAHISFEELESVGSEVRRRNGYDGHVRSENCGKLRKHFARRAIQSYGLTEPVVARINAPWPELAAHSPVRRALSRQILMMELETGMGGQPGMYRRAIELGVAPEWVLSNVERLERIERKVHNRHRFFENALLAVNGPGRIELSDKALARLLSEAQSED
jgi:hypothetical protein